MYGCRCASATAPAVLRMLLEGAADINLCDTAVHTPLMVTAACGNVDSAMVLLEFQADVHMIAQTKQHSRKGRGLSRKVADVFYEGRTRNPVEDYMKLTRAFHAEEERQFIDQYNEVFDMAADADDGGESSGSGGVKVPLVETDLRSDDGESTLWEDKLDGFVSRVAPLRVQDKTQPQPSPTELHLLEARARVLRQLSHPPQETGETVLIIAAQAGHANLCTLLLNRQADGNVTDHNGETALCIAARAGHVEACQALLAGCPLPEALAAAQSSAEAHHHDATVRMLRGYHIHMT